VGVEFEVSLTGLIMLVGRALHVLLTIAILSAASRTYAAGQDGIQIDRISARVAYVNDGERLTRDSASAAGPDFSLAGMSSVTVDVEDSVLVQVACKDQDGVVAHPQQAFVRFVRTDQDTLDSVHVMAKKPIEMRVDLKFGKEIRADREFWDGDATYRMEVIVGDTRMAGTGGGVTWTAIKELRFLGGSGGRHSLFKRKAAGVFDFDVSVKKKMLPEFSSPIGPGARQAPRVAVLLASAAVVAPLPLVLVAWARIGALPLSLPASASELASAIGFEACLLGHMAALVMFWLQWNIVRTWKVMGILMLPTVFFGHRALSAIATRQRRLAAADLKQD
jgi:hypothetical protein